MVQLVKAGRTPEELSREFEPTAQTIHNWVKQTDLDAGVRSDGLTSPERDELRTLRREVTQLRVEREILTRAVTWFAQETESLPPKRSNSLGRTGRSSIAAEMFDGGLLVSGGMATRRGRRRNPPQETPRVNVPRGLTLDGLKLRISGLLA